MTSRLNSREKLVRQILIRTATGTINTRRRRLISYKELWQLISNQKWGQHRTKEIVELITTVSGYDLSHNRPPLNELVVRTRLNEPIQDWVEIKHYLEEKFGVEAPFTSHSQAQAACWEYWGQAVGNPQNLTQAEEGLLQDRVAKFRKRNARLINERKRLDQNTCQACDFRLKMNGYFIIDCHHKYPISNSDASRITDIDELVCLCPTCHRIAHTSKPPLSVSKIRLVRKGCLPT
jgi:hypothetical protein